MERRQGSSGSLNLIKKGNTDKAFQQNKCNAVPAKGKSIVRWHGAVSTDLLKHNVLVPSNEPSSESDSGSLTTPDHKKRNFRQKMNVLLGKVIHSRVKEVKSVKFPCASRKDSPVLSQKLHQLPKIIQHLTLPRETAKRSGGRISQAEAETEQIVADNLIVRSKKTTRRVSVTSLPTGLQKGSYSSKKRHFALVRRKKKAVEKVKHQSEYTVGSLQMQVDDLIETIADKSSRLLAQRHEELRHCETLGDEILQSSKQFQRISKKNTQKYKFKNVCFPCICCCY
ncbi:putative uncharacterized protein C3orf49 homolog isoform X2 [Mixophyes fleayi]|uniref:putative uncharacterized protein C3orf49 homolog isoform X2 n=1 Tax=Mixophyes fleayi TaxID=3061075 RepID=UPI003F4D7CF6